MKRVLLAIYWLTAINFNVNNEIKYGDVDFDCNKRLVANYTFIASTL